MELEYTWRECKLLLNAWAHRVELERDMSRRIMSSSGTYKKGTTLETIWPLSIDKGTNQPTEEELQQKNEQVQQLVADRLKIMSDPNRKTKEI